MKIHVEAAWNRAQGTRNISRIVATDLDLSLSFLADVTCEKYLA